MQKHRIEILDTTEDTSYENYLYRCLAPMPFRKYRKRREYLEFAVPKGFHKKLLSFNGKIVGQVEYAPGEASGYPIAGENVTVMNCIWVLRKAKGHNLGRHLLSDMKRSEKNATGFATLGLENHWSGWLKKEHIERLGFRSIDSLRVEHKAKHVGECFRIHLMWLPNRVRGQLPHWDKSKLLEGVDFCLAHPLYHPQKLRTKDVLQECKSSEVAT